MKIRASLVLLAALVASSVASAADTFVLARKELSPSLSGKSVTQTVAREMNDAEVTLEMGEKKIPGKLTTKESSNETLDVTSPVNVRRTLQSKKTESRMVIMDKEQPGPKKADPLEGLPVIFEEKDGVWSAVLEKGEPTAEQKALLDDLAKTAGVEEDFAIYGDTPRKPGEKWEVDLAKMPGFSGVTDVKGSFVVEFVEVKEVKGSSCAVLKSTVDITGKRETAGEGQELAIKMKGEIITHRSLADLLDLESKTSAEMSMEGDGPGGMKMKIAGPMTVTRTAAIGKP